MKRSNVKWIVKDIGEENTSYLTDIGGYRMTEYASLAKMFDNLKSAELVIKTIVKDKRFSDYILVLEDVRQ